MSHGLADPAPLASLSVTHVYYDPSDPFSFLSAWLALVPQALCVVYATLVWSTRETEVCLAFAGQLACEAVNFALKRLIKEGRPQHHHHQHDWLGGRRLGAWAERQTARLTEELGRRLGPLLGPLLQPLLEPLRGLAANDAAADAALRAPPYTHTYAYTSSTPTTAPATTTPPPVRAHPPGTEPLPFRRGYGMPSSHAQFAGYWALTIALFLLVRYRARGSSGPASSASASASASLSLVQRLAVSVLAFVLALLVAASRVYLHYHTPRQVVVGFVAGLVVAAAWFAVTAVARRSGLVDWALRLPPARYLRLRDLACEEDPVQAGWERWTAREAAVAQARAQETGTPQKAKTKLRQKQKQ